jgi:hypothetical protein
MSLWNTGIIFSWKEVNNKFYKLIQQLTEIFRVNNMSIGIIKAKLINIINNYDDKSIIINPYVWEEFEDYHIDILTTKKN